MNLKCEKKMFVMFLSYLRMSYKNKTDDSWVYRTMRKYKWNRQTDIQQTSCHSNQSRQIEIHACTSKYVIFSTKKGIGMYKCTRKLQLQQNIFKPHPHFLPTLTSS